MVLEFIDSFKSGFYLVQFKAYLRVLVSVKHERSLLGGRIHMVVVLEFGQWEQLVPVILPLIYKESEILLQLLVDLLHLSITLWMISCGGC